jgi:hypothetical protein
VRASVPDEPDFDECRRLVVQGVEEARAEMKEYMEEGELHPDDVPVICPGASGARA